MSDDLKAIAHVKAGHAVEDVEAAYHEAGHGVVTYLNGERTVDGLSIVPDGFSAGSMSPGHGDAVKKYLAAVESSVAKPTFESFLEPDELEEMRKNLPAIDYQNQAEEFLAGEAAEVILGYKEMPDWKVSGYSDWCRAHAALFTLLEIPYNNDEIPEVAVPEAIAAGVQFEEPCGWEQLEVYFDFLFRRVSIKLKHNWSLVEALAAALIELKRLDGKEVEEVIELQIKIERQIEIEEDKATNPDDYKPFDPDNENA